MLQRRQCLTLLAACWAVFSAASAESLIEVYERARISDPQIREADALRLANREALPQSRSALLPQIVRQRGTESMSFGRLNFIICCLY